MKKILCFLFSIMVFNLFAQNNYNENDILYSYELTYSKKDYLPLNGTLRDVSGSEKISHETHYLNGLIEGKQIEKYQSGQLKSERNYVHGKLEGLTKEYYENGLVKLEENYKNNKREGITKHWFDNSKLSSEQNFIAGKMNGTVKKWYKNGNIEEQYLYNNGKKNGGCNGWYKNGQIGFKGNFKNGKEDGKWETYHENGKVAQQCFFRNGYIIEGTQKMWDEDGTQQSLDIAKERFHFKHDEWQKYDTINDGLMRDYNDSGQLKNEWDYHEFLFGGESFYKIKGLYRSWWPNGQLKLELNYDENQSINGIYRLWYPDGQIKFEGNFVNGIIKGRIKTWYPNGQIKADYLINNAAKQYPTEEGEIIIDGQGKYWHENGQLASEVEYTSGKMSFKGKCLGMNGELLEECPSIGSLLRETSFQN